MLLLFLQVFTSLKSNLAFLQRSFDIKDASSRTNKDNFGLCTFSHNHSP